MQQKIRNFFASKLDGHKVLILGFGKEGQSTYRFLRALFPEAPLILADQSLTILEDQQVSEDLNTDYYIGADYLDALQECSFILKSPGISLKDIDLPEGVTVSCQTDLFVELFREQIIGVTGTKGKSTTVSLLKHVLEAEGKEVFLLGNIGKPAFESLMELDEDSMIVLEMSSHQLEYCNSSPKFAILLNLFQEHLDHYHSYMHYQQAKMNIACWQGAGDVLFYGADNETLLQRVHELTTYGAQHSFGLAEASEIRYVAELSEIHFFDRTLPIDKDAFALKGEHNIGNLMAVLGVLHEIGIEPEQSLHHAQYFKGLPHRLEYVGEFSKIHFYNDSIATIPEASLQALKALGKVDVLIAGGYDRGIDYTTYLQTIGASDLSGIILMGELQAAFKAALEPVFTGALYEVENMEQAVQCAFEISPEGSTCLLSPAASSYDQYRNFEDRGDQFKNLIKAH